MPKSRKRGKKEREKKNKNRYKKKGNRKMLHWNVAGIENEDKGFRKYCT